MRYARTTCVVLAIASIASAQSQTIRNSTPPNPLNPVAYLLDPAGAPVVGDTWSPTVDDSLFSPPPAAGATWFVGITTGPASPEVVFSGGTILVNLGGPNPLAQLGPIAATGGAISFDIAVPPMPSIVGSSFSTQAFLDDPGSGFRVANAIDILVGVGPHGLYTVSANEDVLRTITMAGALVTTTTLTLPGESVLGVNGLAKDSSTGKLYAIVKVSGSPAPPAATGHNKRKKGGTAALGAVGRLLVEVDPATGVCTLVGDTGESFAGITFDGTGTLWGVTGDGSATSESLFTISTADGSATFVKGLAGFDRDGETIAYNPADGLLYHVEGNAFFGPPGFAMVVMETIDPANPLAPSIPVVIDAVLNDDEGNAITFDPVTGDLIWIEGCCDGAFVGMWRVPASGGPAVLLGDLSGAQCVAGPFGPTCTWVKGVVVL